MTRTEIAKAFADVTGKNVEFVPMTRDQYAGLGFPGCEDLANMFKFKHDCNEAFCALRDLKKSESLVGGPLKSFETWLRDSIDAIHAAMEG